MGNEIYELEEASDTMTFEFTSVGPKGKIPKLVIYSRVHLQGIYNLSFGDKDLNTGTIDDFVITDNKDSHKVLETVASTVYDFTHKYPDAAIIASGSTKARTRLYQIGISNHLETILKKFTVLGRKEGIWYRFEKNIQYDMFLITLKENEIWNFFQ